MRTRDAAWPVPVSHWGQPACPPGVGGLNHGLAALRRRRREPGSEQVSAWKMRMRRGLGSLLVQKHPEDLAPYLR